MKQAKRTMNDLSASSARKPAPRPAPQRPVRPSSPGSAPNRGARRAAPQPVCRDKFWRIYVTVLAVLSVFVLVAILVVQSVLADYESARPSYVAEKIFRNYFVSKDYASLLKETDFELSVVEDEDDFARFWDSQAQGELSFVRVSADNGADAVRYNVRSDEKTFAAFELMLSGKKTMWGNELYELSKIEFGVGTRRSVKISAPKGAIVEVNGVRLPDECIVEKAIETESCAHMPEGVEGIVYQTYEVKNMLYEYEVKVLTADGSELKTEFDTKTNTHVASVNYDEDLKNEMSDYVIEAAQTYAAAMQNDRSRGQALSYILPSSELYQQTLGLDLFVSAHSGYRFEQVKAEEFYAYDDNTFSCRVSFVHVLTGGSTKFDENGENRENVDITWYFVKSGDRYLIYDRENN